MTRQPVAQAPRNPCAYLPRSPDEQAPRCPGTQPSSTQQDPRHPDTQVGIQVPWCPNDKAASCPGAQEPGTQVPSCPEAQMSRHPEVPRHSAKHLGPRHPDTQVGIQVPWCPIARGTNTQVPKHQLDQAPRCPDAQMPYIIEHILPLWCCTILMLSSYVFHDFILW